MPNFLIFIMNCLMKLSANLASKNCSSGELFYRIYSYFLSFHTLFYNFSCGSFCYFCSSSIIFTFTSDITSLRDYGPSTLPLCISISNNDSIFARFQFILFLSLIMFSSLTRAYFLENKYDKAKIT